MRSVPIFCSLLPVELFVDRGYTPFYLTADELSTVARSEYHCAFHENICSYSKAIYEYLLKKQNEFDFIVIPLSCDAMKKLYSALIGKIAKDKLIALDFPKNKGEEAVMFYADELKKLDEQICKK